MESVRRMGAPLSIDTFLGQMYHASEGHSAFLMGRHSHHGWWYFFPVAIAVKSTPAELAMMGLVVVLACRPGTWRDPARRPGWASGSRSYGSGSEVVTQGRPPEAPGHRYMLLIYPLVVLIAADWLGDRATRRPIRAIVAGVLLMAWQSVSVVGIAPHYLSYFNSLSPSLAFKEVPLAEGPELGYLVDSKPRLGSGICRTPAGSPPPEWPRGWPPAGNRLLGRPGPRPTACDTSPGWSPTSPPPRNATGSPHPPPPPPPPHSPPPLHHHTCSRPASTAGALRPDSAPELFAAVAEAHLALEPRAGYSIFLYDLKDPRIRAAWDASRFRSSPRVPEGPPGRDR